MRTSVYIYLTEKSAESNWREACGENCHFIDDVNSIDALPKDCIFVVQLEEQADIGQIIEITKLGINVVCVTNKPSDEQGITLFQHGIKGYANTFSSVNRIVQLLSTVESGNVWLGASIMQSLILKIQTPPSEDWKELLTEREVESALQVLEGLSNKEIALKLGITERTVKAHLKNVFQKLNVNDRLALVLKIKR